MIQDPGCNLLHFSSSSTWGNSQSQSVMMKGRKKKNLVSIGEMEQKITAVPLAHHSRLLHSDFSRQSRNDTHPHLIFNRFCFQLRLAVSLEESSITWTKDKGLTRHGETVQNHRKGRQNSPGNKNLNTKLLSVRKGGWQTFRRKKS